MQKKKKKLNRNDLFKIQKTKGKILKEAREKDILPTKLEFCILQNYPYEVKEK